MSRPPFREWAALFKANPTDREIAAAAGAIDNIYFAPGIPHEWAIAAATQALKAAAIARHAAPSRGDSQ